MVRKSDSRPPRATDLGISQPSTRDRKHLPAEQTDARPLASSRGGPRFPAGSDTEREGAKLSTPWLVLGFQLHSGTEDANIHMRLFGCCTTVASGLNYPPPFANNLIRRQTKADPALPL